ncbi:TPA: helix-turn-helix domain-containing protein [Haemophilus influenzae]|uniref:helix-turn-helix domain-containing protein n=1 Tax=Haemophilus influenzae TaxID=727 RepID=UPI000CDA9A8F|nr:helix-turn-helix transcriptional regulator [Haemophilus influenzae]MBD3608210.1 helix-turn-helix transcriptional regulator [Haemophilus influenzae]NKB85323.1 helix-turn-helix transcriptional regulator [Haemophilus influenzae]POP29429.1 XRE family transcriptional regulator [Haemophilus influenzae]RDT72525.1 XRE family transcriptional regulator [Haemophilus influenzae]BCB16426.1 hypothetical protein JPHIA_13260 [Haemophilus influenzae]
MEKLEFISLENLKHDLIAQDPTFEIRLVVHKQQQAIVQQLKADRLAKHLTQQDIANLTGIKTQNISRLERGMVMPNADTLIRYAQALGGTFQYVPA